MPDIMRPPHIAGMPTMLGGLFFPFPTFDAIANEMERLGNQLVAIDFDSVSAQLPDDATDAEAARIIAESNIEQALASLSSAFDALQLELRDGSTGVVPCQYIIVQRDHDFDGDLPLTGEERAMLNAEGLDVKTAYVLSGALRAREDTVT